MAKVIKANGLDAILAKMVDDGLRPGEFTVAQVHAQQLANGGTKTLEAVRGVIKRMASEGQLICRKTVINGKPGNAYRPK